jgi:chromosome segregation ATPase
MKIRDNLIQERDRLLNDVTQLRRDLDESSLKQNDLERQIREGNEQIINLQEKITQAKSENMKEAKKRVCLFIINIYYLFVLFFFFRNKLNLNLKQVNKH